MDRRAYLTAVAGGLTLTAGCLGDVVEDGDEPETVGEWSDGSVEFGLPPFQNIEELEQQYAGLFDWLESGFDGVETVEGTQTTSYSATIESVVGGHTEMANLSPLIFVMAADEGITPLAVNELQGATSYNTLLATKDGTGIESIDDLAGETVAMVEPLSTSGGLFPMHMLETAGFDTGGVYDDATDLAIEWAGNHNAAIEQLDAGHVDVAAFGDFLFEDAPPEWIEVIDESEPIPLAAAVTQPETPDAVVDALRDRLLDTPEDHLEEHVVSGFSAYDPDDYDGVRSVADTFELDVSELDEAQE